MVVFFNVSTNTKVAVFRVREGMREKGSERKPREIPHFKGGTEYSFALKVHRQCPLVLPVRQKGKSLGSEEGKALRNGFYYG
jgi:hypothetical protein